MKKNGIGGLTANIVLTDMDTTIRNKPPNQNFTTAHFGIIVIIQSQIRFNIRKQEMGSLVGIGIVVFQFNVHNVLSFHFKIPFWASQHYTLVLVYRQYISLDV